MHVELPQTLQVAELLLRTVTDQDYPFLRSLYRDVRSEELAPAGWALAAMDAFCNSQFDLQDQHYRKHYPHARFYLIERQGNAVGRLYLSDEPGLLALMEVSITSNQRGHGLGTALMHWMTTLADQGLRPMRLYVEPSNPAKRLYERYGFIGQELQGVYQRMTRAPQALAV